MDGSVHIAYLRYTRLFRIHICHSSKSSSYDSISMINASLPIFNKWTLPKSTANNIFMGTWSMTAGLSRRGLMLQVGLLRRRWVEEVLWTRRKRRALRTQFLGEKWSVVASFNCNTPPDKATNSPQILTRYYRSRMGLLTNWERSLHTGYDKEGFFCGHA